MEQQHFRRYLRHYRASVTVVVVASVLLNLLVFAGTLYMLMVYDSVLPSGSMPTLFALFGLLILVYLFQALFEAIRAETMLDLADRFHRDLYARVHHAAVTSPPGRGAGNGDGLQLTRDLDQLHAYLGSTGPVALIDLPWVLFFLLVLALLHWWLGLAALAGVLVLGAIALISSRKTRQQSQDLARVTGQRLARLQAELQMAEPALALGMRERLLARTAQLDSEYLEQQGVLSRIVSRFGGAGRGFRMFVQSLVLTVGAVLVVAGEASGGIILAASVLAGRALAPVDQAIANWRGLIAARNGWARIVTALAQYPLPAPRSITLPPPAGAIAVQDLWVTPPGASEPVVKSVSFALAPGAALAVIGPSAAGKTTLIKAMLGIWPPVRGEVRLDGATHDGGVSPLRTALRLTELSYSVVQFRQQASATQPVQLSGEVCRSGGRRDGVHD